MLEALGFRDPLECAHASLSGAQIPARELALVARQSFVRAPRRELVGLALLVHAQFLQEARAAQPIEIGRSRSQCSSHSFALGELLSHASVQRLRSTRHSLFTGQPATLELRELALEDIATAAAAQEFRRETETKTALDTLSHGGPRTRAPGA